MAGTWSSSPSGPGASTSGDPGRRWQAAGPDRQGPQDDREPTWFPDGRRVAFTSDRSGNLDIWQVDTASGALTAVTDDRLADDYWPAVRRTASASPSSRTGRQCRACMSSRWIRPALAAPELVADGKEGRPSRQPGRRMGARSPSSAPSSSLAFPRSPRTRSPCWTWPRVPGAWSRPRETTCFPLRRRGSRMAGSRLAVDGGIRQWHPDGTDGNTAVCGRAAGDTPEYQHRRFVPATERQPVLGIVEPVTAPDGGVVFAALGDLWWRRASGDLRQLTNDSRCRTRSRLLPRRRGSSPLRATAAAAGCRSGCGIWPAALTAWSRKCRGACATRPLRGMAGHSSFSRRDRGATRTSPCIGLDLGSGVVTPVRAPAALAGAHGLQRRWTGQ